MESHPSKNEGWATNGMEYPCSEMPAQADIIVSSPDSTEVKLVVEAKLHIADLHLWRLGPGHRGLIVSLISPVACSADDIKRLLRLRHTGLSHVTVEVAVCETCAPDPQ